MKTVKKNYIFQQQKKSSLIKLNPWDIKMPIAELICSALIVMCFLWVLWNAESYPSSLSLPISKLAPKTFTLYSVNSADCQGGIPNGEGKQTEGFRRFVFMTPAHWRFDEVALKGQGWLSFSFQVFPVHILQCTHMIFLLSQHTHPHSVRVTPWCLTIYFWEYRYTGGVCPNLSSVSSEYEGMWYSSNILVN